MYDVYTFFGFVAIVLSPCLVALAARARQDREDRRTGARRPEAFGARSKHSRVTSIKAVDSSVSSVARRPVLLPVYANRPREFRESREIVQAAPPRSKRSNGPSIFIRPVQRLTAAQALRARHAKKLAAAELARRRSRATSECIRPVRRVLPIPRSMPKVKLAWCARSY